MANQSTHQEDHLALLADMAQDFAQSQDLNQALLRGVGRITETIDAEGGALFLLNEDGTILRCEACVGVTEITGLELPSNKGIVGQCVTHNQDTIVRDVSKDPNFFGGVDEKTGHTTRSILCAALAVRNKTIGAVELINKRTGDHLFSNADLQLLSTLASAAALAIINARQAEALVEQERVKRELELAREIQASLLPPFPPDDSPVRGINCSAREVSGDFYDHFELADGRICFNIGDVSGKGMNAALLMAKASSLYHCLGKTILSPGHLLAEINREINETVTRGMFVTMVGGIYDPRTGHVRLCNAGHEPVLVLSKDGKVGEIGAEIPPLGVLPDPTGGEPFPEVEFDLAGGSLWLFTDGLTEGYRVDATGDVELERDGVEAILQQNLDQPLPNQLDALVQAIDGKNSTLRDDVTVVALSDAHRKPMEDSEPAPTPDFQHLLHLSVAARPDRLKLIRRAVQSTAETCGCDTETNAEIVLAVDEACQNVIRHSYAGREDGEIAVDLCLERENLTIYLRDKAEPVDPASIRSRDLEEIMPGGLGVHFIREIMDDVSYLKPPEDAGNLLRLQKRISRDPSENA